MRTTRWLVVVLLVVATLASAQPAPPSTTKTGVASRVGLETGVRGMPADLMLGPTADIGVVVREPSWEYRVFLGGFGLWQLRFPNASSYLGLHVGLDFRFRPLSGLAFGVGASGGLGFLSDVGGPTLEQANSLYVSTAPLLRFTATPLACRLPGTLRAELELFASLTLSRASDRDAPGLPFTAGLRLGLPIGQGP